MAESNRMSWIRRWYGDKLADELTELRAEIEALKAQAAPTPVEDESVGATRAEREAFLRAFLGIGWPRAYTEQGLRMFRRQFDDGYAAMRAVGVPTETRGPSAELATLRKVAAALLDALSLNEWRFAARNSNDVVLDYEAVREIAPLLVEALDAIRKERRDE